MNKRSKTPLLLLRRRRGDFKRYMMIGKRMENIMMKCGNWLLTAARI